jgi:hypothetical protein
MLIIRREQMNAFRTEGMLAFQREMVRHLFKFSPMHCEGIGESAVAEAVRVGIDRAAACGFTTRGPVRFYLELMFTFGTYFDNDPQLPPWAAKLLHEPSTDNQLQRADRLHAATREYLQAVLGRENSYARRAVDRFRAIVAQPPKLSAETIADDVMVLMRETYPERFEYVGEPALRTVIERGIAVASEFSLTDTHGAALASLLMFELGHGCFADPLYPWIGSTVAKSGDSATRTERLERRTARYIDLVLKRIEQDSQ